MTFSPLAAALPLAPAFPCLARARASPLHLPLATLPLVLALDLAAVLALPLSQALPLVPSAFSSSFAFSPALALAP